MDEAVWARGTEREVLQCLIQTVALTLNFDDSRNRELNDYSHRRHRECQWTANLDKDGRMRKQHFPPDSLLSRRHVDRLPKKKRKKRYNVMLATKIRGLNI